MSFFTLLLHCVFVSLLIFVLSSPTIIIGHNIHAFAQVPFYFNTNETRPPEPFMGPYNGTSLKVFAIGNLWIPYKWSNMEDYVESGYTLVDIIRKGNFSYIVVEPPSSAVD